MCYTYDIVNITHICSVISCFMTVSESYNVGYRHYFSTNIYTPKLSPNEFLSRNRKSYSDVGNPTFGKNSVNFSKRLGFLFL